MTVANDVMTFGINSNSSVTAKDSNRNKGITIVVATYITQFLLKSCFMPQYCVFPSPTKQPWWEYIIILGLFLMKLAQQELRYIDSIRLQAHFELPSHCVTETTHFPIHALYIVHRCCCGTRSLRLHVCAYISPVGFH